MILTKKLVRNLLTAVAILTISATALMIFSEKNLHNTIIDIVVLLTGSIALVMAVLTEAELERNARRTQKLHSEISEMLIEICDINHDNEILKKKLQQELKIDQEISKKIDQLSK
ncbi:MAG: hypothetical protein Q4A21_02355 [bacterium]|nr:hypothetical protein [bacterium]